LCVSRVRVFIYPGRIVPLIGSNLLSIDSRGHRWIAGYSLVPQDFIHFFGIIEGEILNLSSAGRPAKK